jgi:hypothetical protein
LRTTVRGRPHAGLNEVVCAFSSCATSFLNAPIVGTWKTGHADRIAHAGVLNTLQQSTTGHSGSVSAGMRVHGVRVLLCGMEAPPFHGWNYSLAFHAIYPDLAAAYDLPLVPFLLAGVFGNFDLNQRDMIHPNAAGAQRIADTVWPFLEPMVRAGSPTAAR